MKRIILLLLVLICFQNSNGKESNSDLDLQVKEQIESKFLKDGVPIRFKSNVLILLQGNPTKEDSMIFKELIDTLNILIDKWEVVLVPKGTSNLVVEINKTHTGQSNFDLKEVKDDELIKNSVYIDLPPNIDYLNRKKYIYYNMLRSLALFNEGNQHKSVPIPGSVFTELKPEKMSFHPIDYKIIKELYSQKYEDIKKFPLNTTAGPVSPINKANYILLFQSIAQLLAYAFLIFMALKGAFKNHNYDFMAFIKQGALVSATIAFLIVFSVFLITYNLDSKANPYIAYLSYSIGIFIIGILIACLIYLIEKAIIKNTSSFFLQIMVPMLSIAFITTALLSLFILFIRNIQPEQLPTTLYTNLLTYVCVNTLLIGLGRSIFIFTSKTSEIIIRQKDLELARMSELHKQAELQSLRAKINPHFLYNALNSIASLATTDGRKTEQMALSLSDFFKYSINREQKQLNTLSEELNATRTYLEIEKVRFGERLNFEIDCPTELLDIQIPQLLIQPLVENAIKHGLSKITQNGLIRIAITKTGSQLKIRVYDNGPAFTDGPLTGFGIQNTQERIALLYGAKATINWQNGAEKYIEINLPIDL